VTEEAKAAHAAKRADKGVQAGLDGLGEQLDEIERRLLRIEAGLEAGGKRAGRRRAARPGKARKRQASASLTDSGVPAASEPTST
jgi:hypothetical protein